MQAIIFDFDGVVVDSERFWEPQMDALCRRLIPRWQSGDNARLLTGGNLQDNYASLQKKYAVSFTWETFEREVEQSINIIYGEHTTLLPGVHQLLEALRNAHIPIGLASSSKNTWIDLALNRFGLADFFPLRATAESLKPGEGKPAPTLYLRAATLLHVDPTQCIAIEDSHHGVLSAKNAGMFCIGLRNGVNEKQDLSSADLIIDSLEKLNVKMLKRLV